MGHSGRNTLKIFLLLMGIVTHTATALNCRYQDGKFVITTPAKTFQTSVAKGFQDATLFCGHTLAALYDGDDLTVFDAISGQFEWENVANSYFFSQMVGDEYAVGLYDGNTFWIYSRDSHRFYSMPTEKEYRYAQAVAQDGQLSLYDGKNWFLFDTLYQSFETTRAQKTWYPKLSARHGMTAFYDGATVFIYLREGREIAQTPASRDFPFAHLAIGGGALLAYEGKELVSYCESSKKFERVAVGTGHQPQSIYDPSLNQIRMKLGSDTWVLDASTCKLVFRKKETLSLLYALSAGALEFAEFSQQSSRSEQCCSHDP